MCDVQEMRAHDIIASTCTDKLDVCCHNKNVLTVAQPSFVIEMQGKMQILVVSKGGDGVSDFVSPRWYCQFCLKPLTFEVDLFAMHGVLLACDANYCIMD